MKKPEEMKVVRSKSPEVIPTHDESDSESAGSESAMNDLLDLNCVSCKQMDSSANNQLYECFQCHQLYHQLCHVPKISNDTNLNSWICSSCKGKKEGSQPSSSKSVKSYESSSSSSSSSSHKKPASITIVSSPEKKKVETPKKKAKESSSSSSSRSRSGKK